MNLYAVSLKKKINGKIYHAFSYEPELEDETDCPFIYPSLFSRHRWGVIFVLLVGDVVGDVIGASIHAQYGFSKKWGCSPATPEVVGSAVAALEDPIDVLGNFRSCFFYLISFGVDTPWEVNKIEAKIEDTNNPFDEEASFSFYHYRNRARFRHRNNKKHPQARSKTASKLNTEQKQRQLSHPHHPLKK